MANRVSFLCLGKHLSMDLIERIHIGMLETYRLWCPIFGRRFAAIYNSEPSCKSEWRALVIESSSHGSITTMRAKVARRFQIYYTLQVKAACSFPCSTETLLLKDYEVSYAYVTHLKIVFFSKHI
ncbi:hypothetical protein EYC80_008965 [Monilinia laxa]|uniref:Uncharacterized protein n=1 Tax=Monilinia laxa TaxID=61186 RepID=A0A5N6K236_MONLA|nr:hypothetical protein EYC80_008965 [Monilinia laxa]